VAKVVSGIERNLQRVARIARVSKFVEINCGGTFLRNPLQDEIGADET
jgi:hypothetical protein